MPGRLRRLVLVIALLLALPVEAYRLLPDDAPELAPLTHGQWRFSTRAGSVLVVFDQWDELSDGQPILLGRRQRSAEHDVVAMALAGGSVLMLITSPAHCERYVFPVLGRRRARGTLTIHDAECDSSLAVGSLRVRARRR